MMAQEQEENVIPVSVPALIPYPVPASIPVPIPAPSITYTIGGVKVEFPAKAYPSQVSMMDKIIRGCHKAQNCLLESPTGSGKTLALLCGAIAWQKAEAARLEESYKQECIEHEQKVSELQQKQIEAVQKELTAVHKKLSNDGVENAVIPGNVTSSADKLEVKPMVKEEAGDSDSEEVFVSPLTKRIKHNSPEPRKDSYVKENVGGSAKSEAIQSPSAAVAESKVVVGNDPTKTIPEPRRDKVPTIYFGTRTHKQIAQVVHELGRTKYNDVQMTILSSRTHSCIMDSNYQMNKNDLCNDLLDPRHGTGCRYKNNVKRYCMHFLLPGDFPKIWDLEDLVQFGKKKCTCPYFTARELMASASVIFCPYNYLIDPLIRKSMNISLKGSVLILDEAHNIEDTCREAASFSVEQTKIQDAMRNCEDIKEEAQNTEPYEILIRVFSSVSLWIDQHKNDINDVTDYDKGKLIMFGPQAVESFADYEFGKGKYEVLADALAMIEADKVSFGEENNEPASSISGNTKNLAEGLSLILGYLYNEKYTYDYHVVITKVFSHHLNETPEPDTAGWYNRRKTKQTTGWRYTMHFWCLNPATIFGDIKETARSVILTSGTLSPMDSFQSELGAGFPITLEANHVINASQCWIGSLCTGPSYVKLDGTYKSTNTYQFQDEIGLILLQICSFVPNGILCFVPSYSLLDKLQERWHFTGLREKIEKHKALMWEPRRGDELENLLARFYNTVKETENTALGDGITGVLLIAVCRGKVSEGLDFADKNARAVVTIGIPFPNVKDSQVMLKKSYNDRHQHSKGLLNGRDWYQIQAYRALNQALGRCIRHRNDWGAILLLDSRFSNDSYYKGLSKWVRNKVHHHNEFNHMINHLSSFIQNRLQIDKENS